MQNKLTKIFKKATYAPDPDLSLNVWRSISVRNKHRTELKLWIFTFVGFVSLAGLVPAVPSLLGDLTRSGFYEYFSLIFTDGGSMLSSWRELIFSLAESLPVTSIILNLSLVFVFFLSLRYATKQITKNQFISFETLSI
jgi:hypothetical protein